MSFLAAVFVLLLGACYLFQLLAVPAYSDEELMEILKGWAR